MTEQIAPGCSPLQRKVAQGSFPPVPKHCVVTGGTGFVGLRLVEMLVERGAERVVSLDVVPVDQLPANVKKNLWRHEAIEYMQGDITRVEDLKKAFRGADCVWHIAAAVGPYHPKSLYDKVNFQGTVNVVEACKATGVNKIVMSTSPSTRMDGSDIDGLSARELPSFEIMENAEGSLFHSYEGKWLQPYAASKFKGESYCLSQCSNDLMTVAVAPHQVYGPRDNLFLPNLLEAAYSGQLRVFSKPATGYGMNKVCFTHVDNYAHGLIVAEKALYPESPALGKFYIVTDGDTHPAPEGYAYFWKELDTLFVKLGYKSLFKKFKLPYWLMMIISYFCFFFSSVTGINLKLQPFTILMVTMHRWFSIQEAVDDLNYKPIIQFREGWDDTAEWFKTNWQPTKKGLFESISKQTDNKIQIQKTSVNK